MRARVVPGSPLSQKNGLQVWELADLNEWREFDFFEAILTIGSKKALAGVRPDLWAEPRPRLCVRLECFGSEGICVNS